jgi:hypothetical protein
MSASGDADGGVVSVIEPAGKRVRLRYPGACRTCGGSLAVGESAVYHRATRQVECLQCAGACQVGTSGSPGGAAPSANSAAGSRADAGGHLPVGEPSGKVVDPPAPPEPVEAGVAGASARREYERRVARREQRIRAAHPLLSGLVLALTDEPQSTTAWARGARGEELVANRLDGLAPRGVLVLHDRRIPRTRANIDHIAVGAAGVFVIDAKHYAGRPHLRVEGGLLRPRTETLVVGRRDCTRLVDGVLKQVGLVQAALAADDRFAGVPVRGVLCFVDADWPLIGGSFTTRGVDVLWPKKIGDRVCAETTLSEEQIAAAHRHLATGFPPA